MSILSMTGFGRDVVDVAGIPHVIELRAVNHRFLDLRLRLPRGLAGREALVRGRIGERLSRGRVDVTVTTTAGDGTPATAVRVNWPLAEAVRAAHAELAERLGVPDACDTRVVGAWPGVMTAVAADELDAEVVDQALAEGLGRALDALVHMRRVEGKALAETLHGHLDVLAAHRDAIAAEAPSQVAAWRARFEKRLRDFVAGAGREVDEGRVLHEVAAFAEKTDVAEELARLASHIDQARALVDDGADEGVGRRLDFICQEMLRETNTIGSKVQAVELTRLVVDAKAELERLREQVQNVE